VIFGFFTYLCHYVIDARQLYYIWYNGHVINFSDDGRFCPDVAIQKPETIQHVFTTPASGIKGEEPEIAEQLNLNQSTISRDIKALKEMSQQFVFDLAKSDLTL
jgi:HTH domain